MLLVPAIDLRGGACVRLYQGDFGAETRYAVTPQDLLERYRALGARWLHVVDLDGARDGARANRAIVRALAGRGVKLQVGGGIRSAADVEALLQDGVDRAVIGSAAVEQPEEVAQWLARFGPERLCLAFDLRLDPAGIPRVCTRGWRQTAALTLWDALAAYEGTALRHVLCTDIERDGTLTGPNLELYAEALRRHAALAWQASGGVRAAEDLSALAALGLAAAVIGKALLEGRIAPDTVRLFDGDA